MGHPSVISVLMERKYKLGGSLCIVSGKLEGESRVMRERRGGITPKDLVNGKKFDVEFARNLHDGVLVLHLLYKREALVSPNVYTSRKRSGESYVV